jgi:hypothetical protein
VDGDLDGSSKAFFIPTIRNCGQALTVERKSHWRPMLLVLPCFIES